MIDYNTPCSNNNNKNNNGLKKIKQTNKAINKITTNVYVNKK